jgi:hypothetical protein
LCVVDVILDFDCEFVVMVHCSTYKWKDTIMFVFDSCDIKSNWNIHEYLNCLLQQVHEM